MTYTPSLRPRVLVVGARSGSLGEAVVNAATLAGYDPYTAGINREAIPLDPVRLGHDALVAKLASVQPTFLVSTVGLNMAKPPAPDGLEDWYRWHNETNLVANMKLLRAYQAVAEGEPGMRHFIAISSNSAHIPRTQSAAYCASKAALSMALRVEAREGARSGSPVIVYGYEPGLLRGTPMTIASRNNFAGSLHRMPGEALQDGIDPADLAELIVANLRGTAALNGLMMRYDGGEL